MLSTPEVKEQERARFQIKLLLDDINGPIHYYSEWEENFIFDLAKRLEEKPDYQFSHRQLDKINQIFKKEQQ